MMLGTEWAHARFAEWRLFFNIMFFILGYEKRMLKEARESRENADLLISKVIKDLI